MTDPVGTILAAILFTLAAIVGLGVVFYGPVKRTAADWRELAGIFWRGFREGWNEAREERRIRWYNRLAAWLYPWITEPLVTLAVPVWQAEAEADIEQMYREEERQSEIDAIAGEAWQDGYEAAAREDDRHRRPY